VAAAVAEQARAAGTALAGQEVGFAQGDSISGGATSAQVLASSPQGDGRM